MPDLTVRQIVDYGLVAIGLGQFPDFDHGLNDPARGGPSTSSGRRHLCSWVCYICGSRPPRHYPESLGIFAWIGMATAIGDATRSRRAYLAEVEERARRTEQTREDEANRRVIQERLRIARELHDVVAHHRRSSMFRQGPRAMSWNATSSTFARH